MDNEILPPSLFVEQLDKYKDMFPLFSSPIRNGNLVM